MGQRRSAVDRATRSVDRANPSIARNILVYKYSQRTVTVVRTVNILVPTLYIFFVVSASDTSITARKDITNIMLKVHKETNFNILPGSQFIQNPTAATNIAPTLSPSRFMPWFHLQFIACYVLQFFCSGCRLSNVMENIHEAKMLQPWIFSITLESLQLLHKNCSTLHATNCTWKHVITHTHTHTEHEQPTQLLLLL